MGTKQFYVRDESTGSTFFVEDTQAALALPVESRSPVVTVVRAADGSVSSATDTIGTVDQIVRDGSGAVTSFHQDGHVYTISRDASGLVSGVAA